MTPLVLHRQGVYCLRAGDERHAERFFLDAIRATETFVAGDAAFRVARDRAALIPGADADADQLAREFVGRLGGWIAEWHFDLFYQALIELRLSAARLHWRILQTADLLPALHASVQLGLRRDMVCQRLKVAAEDDADERRRARKYVELILRVDPGNLTARQLAVEAHVRCANEILRLEKKRGQRTVYGPTRPRERRQLRLTTRQLNHHLIAGRRQKLDAALLGDGYATLGGCHVQQGNADKAMKALRRARRLKGGDREITRLLRTIRGMPRTS